MLQNSDFCINCKTQGKSWPFEWITYFSFLFILIVIKQYWVEKIMTKIITYTWFVRKQMMILFLKTIRISLQRISLTVNMNTNKEVAQFTTIIRKLLIHKNYHNIRISNRGKYAQMNMVCVLYIRTCSEAWMWWLSLNENWISPSFKIIIQNENV